MTTTFCSAAWRWNTNQIWVSDITYIEMEDPTARLGYRFCFLTLVTDAYSKKILGWCVAPTLEAAYSIKALALVEGRCHQKGAKSCAMNGKAYLCSGEPKRQRRRRG